METFVSDEEFDLSDLDLSELTVTVMRDTVALPESGASQLSEGIPSCSCGWPWCIGDEVPV